MSEAQVLVTGGAGFIGSHIAERFARGGSRVRVLDDLSTGFEANCDPAWDLVRGDVRDRGAVERVMRGVGTVVHLAAFTSVPESLERFEDCYRTNTLGTWNVLEAAHAEGVRRVILASSSAVYPELPHEPKRESDLPGPLSPYGFSKLEGEHLLSIYRESYGLSGVALRFFNVYGPRQPATSAYAAAVPIFLARSLRGESIRIFGDGLQVRDFIYVSDVAEAVHQASGSTASGVFNVAGGKSLTVLDLADRIAALTGSRAPHRFEPPRPGDLRYSTAAVAKIREAMGWAPSCELEKGLAETLAWMRERLASG